MKEVRVTGIQEILERIDRLLVTTEGENVQDFAKQIQGKGEPVEWIPCRIGGVFYV